MTFSWIDRDLASSLRAALAMFPVVVVVGPRQVGKTALIDHCLPGTAHVSLGIPAEAEAAAARPERFLAEHPCPLVIDEIQQVPALARHVGRAVDEHPGAHGLFVLVGVQGLELMTELEASLAGRAAVMPMLSLSATEWRRGGRLTTRRRWEDFVWTGGFPALWSDPAGAPERDRWYRGYLATLLEREVRRTRQVASLAAFERFLRACARRIGRLLNMSEMGREVGISPSTARSWLRLLAGSNQIRLLRPHPLLDGGRSVRTPKLYFTDTGFAAYLIGLDMAAPRASSTLGVAVWNHHVVAQWTRWREWQRPDASLWFWQDRMGNEVDLLIEVPSQLMAIACCASERPDTSSLRGIRKLRERHGTASLTAAFVACRCEKPYYLGEGTVARAGWEVWEG